MMGIAMGRNKMGRKRKRRRRGRRRSKMGGEKT